MQNRGGGGNGVLPESLPPCTAAAVYCCSVCSARLVELWSLSLFLARASRRLPIFFVVRHRIACPATNMPRCRPFVPFLQFASAFTHNTMYNLAAAVRVPPPFCSYRVSLSRFFHPPSLRSNLAFDFPAVPLCLSMLANSSSSVAKRPTERLRWHIGVYQLNNFTHVSFVKQDQSLLLLKKKFRVSRG